jgi:hypothetical protein
MSISFSDNPTDSLAENTVPDTAERLSSPPDDPRTSKKADLAGPGIGDFFSWWARWFWM